MEVLENPRGYKYLEWRYGPHCRQEIKVWVNRNIPLNGNIDFPVRDAEIIKTEKGTLVMRPHPGGMVYFYECQSGYRGSAEAIVEDCGKVVASFDQLHSQTGSLGETACLIINANMDAPCLVRWEKSGRNVSRRNGVDRLTPDGNIEEIIDDPEVCGLLD